MKHLISPQTQAGRTRSLMAFPGAPSFLLILAILALLVTSCGRDLPLVDMDDLLEDDSTPIGDDRRPTLRIAVAATISPETTRDLYKDLVHLIADRVGRRAVLAQRRTYAEVNNMLEGKELDFAFVCSGPYTQGHDEFGMEILTVPVVHGEKVYYSYILAGRDSDVESFDDLKGRRFVFTDPHSNTGCLVPTYMLARRGQTPRSFFADTFFSHSHDNSIRAVAEGQADGAAVDSLIWEFLNAVDSSLTSRTRIIEKSPPYGIPPVVVHPDLDPDLKKLLREVFLSLHEDKKASALLSRLQIDRFAQGEDSMYDTVREMRRWVEKSKEDGP